MHLLKKKKKKHYSYLVRKTKEKKRKRIDTPSWNHEQPNVTKGVKNTNILVMFEGCIMYECLGIFQ